MANYIESVAKDKQTIKEEPWKAQKGDSFFVPSFPFIDSSAKHKKMHVNLLPQQLVEKYYNYGLMCKTPEDAEELSKILIEIARNFQKF